jgi:hypothetical protein
MNLHQKRVFLCDVAYVVDQAEAFHRYVALGYQTSLADHPFASTIHNAILESALSFLRKLNEFFNGNRDASIKVFFPNETGSYLWSKEDSEFLNDRVMHLSLCHAVGEKTDWAAFLDTHVSEARRRYDLFIRRLQREQSELFE